MIGDAVTDMAAGRAVGAKTVLMLTGVTSRETAESLPDDERPTFMAEDGQALARILVDIAGR
jgi:ribonucleotide monophosphatase NagD (HAD superfamily)